MTEKDHGEETVDPGTREQMLEDAEYRCEFCGRTGVARGGSARLEIHHIDRDPDDMEEHDPRNLSVLCRHCHAWLHQQPDPEEAPVELTDADLDVLRPKDIEILGILAEHGPLTTGEIVEAHTADLTVVTARERLWVLMGLDNQVPSREQQLVDQDATTGEWGLDEQITHSERGRIPDDARTLLQRAADERVRQALARGCDRDVVADVMDVHPRTTWNKEKRARAYGFPLDAIDGRNGGRPSTDETGSGDAEPSATGVAEHDDLAQQRLDAAGETAADPATDGGADDDSDGPDAAGTRALTPRGDDDQAGRTGDIEAAIQRAIEALQAVEDTM